MRIRTIKPEFFLHDGLFDAEKETGLPIRVAFVGLWCASDRAGRFKWEPRRLGVAILPYDGVEFSRVLDALTTRGFIRQYRVGDELFGEVPSFSRHQVINPRERESELPEPTDYQQVPLACATRDDASTTRDDACSKEGKGREGKGRTREARATSLDHVRLFCEEEDILGSDAEWFWHKCEANGWTNGGKPMKDWRATLRSWKAASYLPSQKNGHGTQTLPLERTMKL